MDVSPSLSHAFEYVRSIFRPRIDKLRLDKAALILDHDYLPTETGYYWGDDGLAHVACSTYMRDVTPAMIEWWFGWIRTTEQYQLWHPRDHISSAWDGPLGQYIGGAHLVEERIGGEAMKLRIRFRDPEFFFGPDWRAKFAAKGYGTAICARVAAWQTGKGAYVDVGHMFHLMKIEPDGSRMRSRFWLGDVEGLPLRGGRFVPEKVLNGLMTHCHEEMSILASFLPKLYREEMQKVEAMGNSEQLEGS